MQIIEILGRIILGGFFVMSGMNHFTKMKMMISMAEKNNLPMPKAAIIISGVALITGGLGILLWLCPGIASGILVIFLLAASFTMHKFWDKKNASPQVKMSQMHFFMGNIALAGALLILLSLVNTF